MMAGGTAANLEQILDEAIQEVLETMFFLTLDEPSAGAGTAGFRSFVLDFRGGAEGTFRLAVEETIAPAIAAGFAGRDEHEMEPVEIDAVLSEMTNMVCGNFLSRLDGAKLYHLSSPRRANETEAAEPVGLCKRFPVEGGDLVVCIDVRETP